MKHYKINIHNCGDQEFIAVLSESEYATLLKINELSEVPCIEIREYKSEIQELKDKVNYLEKKIKQLSDFENKTK